MPRAVARAWVSKEGPWGLCRAAGPRACLTGSAWAVAETPVAWAAKGAVPAVSCCPAGGDCDSGGGDGGGTDETDPSSSCAAVVEGQDAGGV